ncbi:hypothetical protein FHS79_002588, partial [Polymorphobacter multimanifer]
HAVIHGSMINPAKPEIKAARPRTYTTLWDTIVVGGFCALCMLGSATSRGVVGPFVSADLKPVSW